MRVNARLDGEYERQVEFLTEATGLGVSDVLKASVQHYYRLVSQAGQPKLAHLSPLIGRQGSGRSDISTKASEMVGESIAQKHRKRARFHR